MGHASELAEYHETACAAMRSTGLPAANIHITRMEELLAGAGTEASQAAEQLRKVMQVTETLQHDVILLLEFVVQ